MSAQSAITQLLQRFSTDQLVGFLLVMMRVTPLFFFAPMFSSTMIPARVKTVVAIGLSLGLTPIALSGQHLPDGAAQLIGLVVESALVGAGLAFTVGILFAAIQTAGGLIDVASGFSFGQQIDPLDGSQSAIFSQFYGMLGAIIFLAIGGDGLMMRGLAATFQRVPLAGSVKFDTLVAGVESAGGSLLLSAVEVSAPVLLAIIITDVAFGVVSRVVPQLNVFAVGFPMKVAVSLLTVSATLPFVAGWISNQLTLSVGSAVQAIQGI